MNNQSKYNIDQVNKKNRKRKNAVSTILNKMTESIYSDPRDMIDLDKYASMDNARDSGPIDQTEEALEAKSYLRGLGWAIHD